MKSMGKTCRALLVGTLAIGLLALLVLASACGSKTGTTASTTQAAATQVAVPDLKGLTASEANAALDGAKLKAGGTTLDFSDETAEGCVIRQTPEAGTMVNEGTQVAKVISKGPIPESVGSGTTGSTAATSSAAAKTPPKPSDRVKRMQEELKEAGFYTGPVDGLYGAATVAAIKAAQKAQGLTVDGIYGPLTHDAVISKITGNAMHSANPRPSASIRLLQQELKDLGFDPGAVDGVFGSKTIAALKAFQKSKGLPQTGKLDPATDAALTAAMQNFAN
jgi:peptidoglycan hydrolase-like protein with peptidoglycan-binding domain